MEYNHVTFDDVLNNYEFKTYITRGNELLGIEGFTDHSEKHTLKVAYTASEILAALDYSERDVELAKIAGYVHDVGNMINRHEHDQTGAVMVFQILTKMNMHPEEIATIVAAVGNHDEGMGSAVNPISAALIIADKSDVRRSRVRNQDFNSFDIHDRVNYAVEEANLKIEKRKVKNIIRLVMKIDKHICPVMDYFEIFLGRMLMCKGAAKYLSAEFQLNINDAKIL